MSAPTDMRALGRKGGLVTASTRDMRVVAAHARKRSPQSLDYWRARVVEEYGALDASDCDQRARAAMRLHFTELGKKSAAARRRNSNGNENRADVAAGPVRRRHPADPHHRSDHG